MTSQLCRNRLGEKTHTCFNFITKIESDLFECQRRIGRVCVFLFILMRRFSRSHTQLKTRNHSHIFGFVFPMCRIVLMYNMFPLSLAQFLRPLFFSSSNYFVEFIIVAVYGDCPLFRSNTWAGQAHLTCFVSIEKFKRANKKLCNWRTLFRFGEQSKTTFNLTLILL